MGLDTEEDYKLLQKIKTGDEAAFRRAYDKYHKKLYGLAFKYLRTRQRAEDVVHDTFVKLWNSKKNLDLSGSLRGFLFTAAKNRVLDLISRHKRSLKKDIEWAYQQEMDRTLSADVINISEYRQAVRAASKQLPEKRQQVYMLRTEDGLTCQEVAAHLEVSVHTVKTQYYNATKFIRAYVNDHINIEEAS